MTANRWWVRVAARWIARVDGVSGQLRLVFLAMTGNGIVLSTLKDYGLERFAVPFLVGSAGLMAAYVYYYTEGGVWNQMQRDRADLSSNFAGPNMAMTAQLYARAIGAQQKGEPLTDDERDAVTAEVTDCWIELRDGVNIEEIDNDTS